MYAFLKNLNLQHKMETFLESELALWPKRYTVKCTILVFRKKNLNVKSAKDYIKETHNLSIDLVPVNSLKAKITVL